MVSIPKKEYTAVRIPPNANVNAKNAHVMTRYGLIRFPSAATSAITTPKRNFTI